MPRTAGGGDVRALTRGGRILAAALAIAIGAAVMSACAAAVLPAETPAAVRAVDVAEGGQDEAVEVLVDGGAAGVDVTFREITIEPGAATGEHCHYGQLIAVVQEGELTHYSPTHPGGVRVYETGDSIIEGPGYVHEGRNEGDDDVVLWVNYVTPDGDPLAETDLAQCDG